MKVVYVPTSLDGMLVLPQTLQSPVTIYTSGGDRYCESNVSWNNTIIPARAWAWTAQSLNPAP